MFHHKISYLWFLGLFCWGISSLGLGAAALHRSLQPTHSFFGQKAHHEAVKGNDFDAIFPSMLTQAESNKHNAVYLFSDGVGFTTQTEEYGDKNIAALVMTHTRMVAELVKKNGGHIDNYGGDLVFAFFPVQEERSLPQAIEKALRTAQGILDIVERNNKSIAYRKIFNCPYKVGVGLHYGSSIMAQLGIKGCVTSIGSAINRASRVEGVAHKLSEEFLPITITEDFYNLLNTHDKKKFTHLTEPVDFKGIGPQTVYAYLKPSVTCETIDEEIDIFDSESTPAATLMSSSVIQTETQGVPKARSLPRVVRSLKAIEGGLAP